jgi:hypothetical protein
VRHRTRQVEQARDAIRQTRRIEAGAARLAVIARLEQEDQQAAVPCTECVVVETDSACR